MGTGKSNLNNGGPRLDREPNQLWPDGHGIRRHGERRPTTRRIAAVGPSIRRGALFTLADLRTTQNHYLLKEANLLDRAMRAGEPQIEQNAERYLQRKRFWDDGELEASSNRLPPMNR